MTRRLLALLITFFIAAAAFAGADPDSLAREAIDAYVKKDYARSANLFRAAIDAGSSDAELFYNASCASALAGRVDAAFALLERAVAAGYDDAARIEKDGDLESLHQDPRWNALMTRARAANEQRKRMWNNPLFATPYRESLSEDERIAGVSRFWAEAKFNFANFDLVPDLDWDAVYLQFLPRARKEQTTKEYYQLLSEMAAHLHDGHTGVWAPKALWPEVYAQPVLRTEMIEGRVLVVGVYTDVLRSAGIHPGLELVAVDGVPVLDYAAQRVAPYENASTPQDLQSRVYGRSLLAGSSSKRVRLTLKSGEGEVIEREVERLSMPERAKVLNQPPFELRQLPGGIAHVILRTFDVSAVATEFENRFDEIAKSTGLILDVRENGGGNSGVGYRILAVLTGEPFRTSRWRTREYRPVFRAWQRAEGVFVEEGEVVQPKGEHPYRGPVVVLTSAATYSAAEDFVVAFDAMKRGTIIGEPTGGSTGQPLLFDLPGGGTGRVCAKRDSYPDGREFVGAGVAPGILMRPAVQDIRAGRDVVLERAVRFIQTPSAVAGEKAGGR